MRVNNTFRKMPKETRLRNNIMVFKYLTLWPAENDSKLLTLTKDLGFYSLTVPLYIALLYELKREISGSRDSTESLFVNILNAICMTIFFLFSIIFQTKRKYIKGTITKLYELEEYFDSPETRKMEKRIRILSFIAFGYIIQSTVVYVFFPSFNLKSCHEKKKYAVYSKEIPCGVIFPVKLPFDYRNSPAYELVFLNITIIAYLFAWVITGCLMFIFALTLHTIGHLRNFKNILSNAVSMKDEELMKRCIDYHNAIIRYWKYVDGCFSPFSFLLLIFASTIIGMLEYEIVLEKSNVSLYETSRYVIHLTAWIVFAFSLCKVAQMLLDESEGVSDELYKMDWLECPLVIQKNILFMIMRSQKPLIMSTGPIGQLKFFTFIMILRSGYSFLVILTNVN